MYDAAPHNFVGTLERKASNSARELFSNGALLFLARIQILQLTGINIHWRAKKEFIFSKLFWYFLSCSHATMDRIACMRCFLWNELTISPCRNAMIVIFGEHKMQMSHYLQLSQRFEIVSRDVLNYHAIGNNVLTDANGRHGAGGQCHHCQ